MTTPEKTEATKKKKLLPCPFCGGKPRMHTLECGGFDSLEEGCVKCTQCGAQGPSFTTSWDDIGNAWNKRV